MGRNGTLREQPNTTTIVRWREEKIEQPVATKYYTAIVGGKSFNREEDQLGPTNP
jgi:hypothetical protein